MQNPFLMNSNPIDFLPHPAIIGMIHVPALPGTPLNKKLPNSILDQVLREAQILKKAGIDSILVENMHDIPYLNREVGPEITSLMSVLAYEIKRETNLPIGIQILAGANKAALAAAHASGADFIRAEGYVFAHVADEGLIESDAGELLRYRKSIGADKIKIFTDVKKKHSSHAITSDVDVRETALAAQYFLSDGIVISGSSTGCETNKQELIWVRKACSLPVIVGSGITIDNVVDYLPLANALIVGSWLKKEGKWQNDISKNRVARLMEKAVNWRSVGPDK